LSKKKKIKELKKERDTLALYQDQILKNCILHTGGYISAAGDPLKLKLTDFTLIYNVHTLTAFFIKYMNENYSMVIDNDNIKEVIDLWTKNFDEKIKPQYEKEIKLIMEEFNKEPETKETGDLYS